ncbi:MAG: MgtC/SapB family protein [Gammaproteobacteria bacterium]|jgi:uncharacterized membrane protein (DUF4010 family)
MSDEQQILYHLGVALAIGLLIGIERGWKEREAQEGSRIAGMRTYGLIGLLGGVVAVIAEHFGALVLGFTIIAMAAVFTVAYVLNFHRDGDEASITSLVAAMLALLFGVLAGMGHVIIAASSGVVTTLILSYKPVLHHWLEKLEQKELRAGIKLLLISVVLLPILPDRGYGPWQALNPYEIWWMVVLIASISFIGYFAIKIGGARRGIVFTGLFGGLATSTAVTVHFSRLSHREESMLPILSMGILLACGTMFPRMLFVASLLNRELFAPLLVPAAVMAVLVYVPALLYWRGPSEQPGTASPLKNPLELKTALGFGILLALVMLLGKGLQSQFGEVGILALAAASGIADVDAITLSLARMSQGDLAVRITVTGIVLAASVNNLVKGGIAFAAGGPRIGLRVGLPLAASAIGGILSVWLLSW